MTELTKDMCAPFSPDDFLKPIQPEVEDMEGNKMTNAEKKLVTERLGECWHEFHLGYNYRPHGPISKEDEGCPNQCKKCHKGNNIWLIKNRTFTTPTASVC